METFSWNGTPQFETSVNGVQNLLSLAQTQAVARDTYVWVGFTTNYPSLTGLPQLTGAAIYSADGTATSTPGVPLTKAYRWTSVHVTSSASVYAGVNTSLPPASNLTNLTSAPTPPTGLFPAIGSLPANFATWSITFTPQGEALLTQSTAPTAQTGYQPAIDIGLQKVRGNILPPAAGYPDDIVLRLYGGSGKIREFRLP